MFDLNSIDEITLLKEFDKRVNIIKSGKFYYYKSSELYYNTV
jgi:hypothetical protein